MVRFSKFNFSLKLESPTVLFVLFNFENCKDREIREIKSHMKFC